MILEECPSLGPCSALPSEFRLWPLSRPYRQLTPNFELWVEICVPSCFHNLWRFHNRVCPSVPREQKFPYLRQISPTVVIDTSMERSSWVTPETYPHCFSPPMPSVHNLFHSHPSLHLSAVWEQKHNQQSESVCISMWSTGSTVLGSSVVCLGVSKLS